MTLIPPARRLADARAAYWMLAICLLSPAAFAQETWIGRQFMPRDDLQAKVRNQKVPIDQLALPLAVENEQGEWLWVGNAWVRKEQVVPLEDAAIYYTDYMRAGGDQEWAFKLRGIGWMAQGELANAVKDFTEAIRLNPASAENYYARGRARDLQHDYDRALKDYDRSIQLDPENMEVWNALAWTLATCPDSNYRDGEFAILAATKACELSEWKHAATFDTLAAAYAEAENFEQAVHWQRKTVESIEDELKEQCRARLALYEAGKPYHGKLGPAQAAADEAGGNELVIRIEHGALTINGKTLEKPYKTADLVAVLGEPNRMLLSPQRGGNLDGLVDKPERASSLVWDDLGVTAFRTREEGQIEPPGVPPQMEWGDPVESLTIQLRGNADPEAEFIPYQPFPGTLSINGVQATADSTVESLNRSLRDQPIQEDEGGWYAAKLNDLRIEFYLDLAEDEDTSAEAKLAGLDLIWDWEAVLAEETDKPGLAISVDEGALTINGRKLSLPCQTRELIAVLGQPTRMKELVHIWDQHGVTAVQPKESDQIAKLTVALGKDVLAMAFGASPKRQFQGKLTIDGMSVSAGSTIEEINNSRKEKPFQESKGRHIVRHGNVNVILERADPDFNSEGVNLSSLIIEAEANGLAISVNNGAVTINGTKLTLPCKTSKLIDVLGQPTRLRGLIHIWDDDGVTAVQPEGSDQIKKVSVALGPAVFGPAERFQGSLTINGAPFSAGSSIEVVNNAGKEKPFRESKGNRYIARYGDVSVTLLEANPFSDPIGVNFLKLTIEAEPNGLAIDVEDGALSINGTKLMLPCMTYDLVAILGSPDRTRLAVRHGGDPGGGTDKPDGARTLVWDEAGLVATRSSYRVQTESGSVVRWRDPIQEIGILLCEKAQPSGGDPSHLFSGTLTIDGVRFNADATIEQLNQSHPEKPFKKDDILDGWYVGNSGLLEITLTPAEGEATAAGKNFGTVYIDLD